MQRYTAAVLWTGPGRVFAPGQLTVGSDGRVAAVGPARRRRLDFQAIVPGLVNAHAHLQLEPLRRPRRQFVPWLRDVIASRRDVDPSIGLSHAGEMLARLLATGCTSVGEVDSLGTSHVALRAAGVAGRCYQELLGFDVDARAARTLVAERDVPATRRSPRGFSPHAPYSVSPALLRAAAASGRPLMVHVAESEAEVEFLATGRGPFRDLLADLGRLPRGFRPSGRTAVDWLYDGGALGPRTALVHCQHLTANDVDRIEATGASIVVCPGTTRYFRRRPVDIAGWIARGIPVALGTDSRASHEGEATMLGELAAARELWPDVAPQALLAAATSSGGRALARRDLGVLRVGSPADFVALRYSGRTSEQRMLDALTSSRARPERVFLRGIVTSGA